MATPAQIQKRLQHARKPDSGKKMQSYSFSIGPTASHKEIADFTRQLSTMMAARLPLTRALTILIKQKKESRFRNVLLNVVKQINEGKSFSQSLSIYPKLFNSLYVNMIRVGEHSGKLAENLNELAEYLEKLCALRRKAITALTYPAIIVFVAVGTLGFLLFGVMPTFQDMFMDFEANLPLPVRLITGISAFFQSHALILMLSLLAAGIIITYYLKTPGGNKIRDKMQIILPLTGKVHRKILIARFSRTLGTLLLNGVSLMDALSVTQRSMGNCLFASDIEKIRICAEKGEPMEKSLSTSKLFPDLVIQMIAVGEETAELPEMLNKTASYYEAEVDAAIDALTAIIEPVIIVILGVLLGGIVIGIYLQIFDLMEVIQ